MVDGSRRDGDLFEREIPRHFPGLKGTKGSGRIWGDGDLTGHGISFEAKDQKKVSLDAWWSQTRRQAMSYGQEPVLVMRRPPAQLEFGPAATDEILAVCHLSFLAALHDKIKVLENTITQIEARGDARQ